MQLAYKKLAVKDIAKLPAALKKRLGIKLAWYASQRDPLVFAKPLKEPADAQYRFRVGNYRILFDVEADTIVILRVQHRKEVYK